MFTYATAISRLGSGQQSLWVTNYGTMSDAQKLQRLNEVMDRIYEEESWRGVREPVALTCSSGIITLSAAYLRLEKRIRVTTTGHCNNWLEVKGEEYRFQWNGPGNCYCGVAVDMGDDATTGQRKYRLADPNNAEAITQADALTYEGYARKRFVWVSDTATVVVPDCFAAIKLGVRAANCEDQGQFDKALGFWQQCFAILDSNLGEFVEGNDPGSVQITPPETAEFYAPI